MALVGLGRLDAQWAMLPPKLTKTLEVSLWHALPLMNAAQYCSAVSGMGLSAWRLENFSSSLRRRLLDAAVRVLPSASIRDVSLLFNGLSNLGLRWVDLSHSLSRALVVSVGRVLNKGDATEVAGVMLGLGMMGCGWDNSLPGSLRDMIKAGVLRVSRRPSGAPGQMWSSFNRWALPSAKSSVEPLSTKSAANIMYGLSLMVFDSTRAALDRDLDEVHLALIDSISYLGVGKFSEVRRWPSLRDCWYLSAVTNIICPMHLCLVSVQAEREQVVIYTQLLQTVLPNSDLVQSNPRCALLRADKPSKATPSKLQESIVVSLKEALKGYGNFGVVTLMFVDFCVLICPPCPYALGIQGARMTYLSKMSTLRSEVPFLLTLQYSKVRHTAVFHELLHTKSTLLICGTFSSILFTMGTCSIDGTPVAFIEVDGPQHFDADSRLKRKDMMKEALYRSKHPNASFTRVRFDMVNKLGSAFIGTEISNYIAIVRAHGGVATTATTGDIAPQRLSNTHVTTMGKEYGISRSPASCDRASSALKPVYVHNDDNDINGWATRQAYRELTLALNGKPRKTRAVDFILAGNNIHLIDFPLLFV